MIELRDSFTFGRPTRCAAAQNSLSFFRRVENEGPSHIKNGPLQKIKKTRHFALFWCFYYFSKHENRFPTKESDLRNGLPQLR